MSHEAIVNHFLRRDLILCAALKEHIDSIPPIHKSPPEMYLQELRRSIVGQQLSVAAANTIWTRTHSVVDDWNRPDKILTVDEDKLRACGMSYQKIRYIKNVAVAIRRRELQIDALDTMSNDEIVAELTKITGIGRWTAEMFLIFTLDRKDVFSAGDLGLRNAIDSLYGTSKISPREAEALAARWSPYRSMACRVLWRTLDSALN